VWRGWPADPVRAFARERRGGGSFRRSSRRWWRGGRGDRWRRRSSPDRRTFGDAPTVDRRVAQVRVVDPHHPLFGMCFPVSDRRSGRGPRLIVIRLPDGRERAIPRLATAPTSASDDRAARDPSRRVHISVRTLLPLANHVRAVLASRYADLEGGGGRDLDQMAATQAGDVATPMAAATSRDTASVGAMGGAACATPATAARPLRGGSSC